MSVAVSIVIPVYNSAAMVGETIDRVMATCDGAGWRYEVVAADDASVDSSWDVLQGLARRHARLRVLRSRINTGQHATLLTALRASTGQIVVCMDDDLQHAPEAIPLLVRAVEVGHDVAFARFAQSRHARWRRVGSALMRRVDRHVFAAPATLTVTSFRAIRRDVVDRVCAYEGASPYIRGQLLLASRSSTNVDVEHGERADGTSSYTAAALVTVVLRVLFEWSRVPAWCALALGVAVGAGGVLLTARRGWSPLAVLPMLHGSALAGLGVAGLMGSGQKGRS